MCALLFIYYRFSTVHSVYIYIFAYCELDFLFLAMLPPPDSLARRWRRLKKHCSFSSGDNRLVRSKSFTEQETLPGSRDTEQEDREKYHTVGTRDGTKFQGIREKIAQWNSDLKKRRSTENLAHHHFPAVQDSVDKDSDESSQFVTALPQQGQVKNAVVVSYGTSSKAGNRDGSVPLWSPSPSPPISDISSDSHTDNRRGNFYGRQPALFQDQDSGYDGFCPEQSIYSTTSSDSSSVISEADNSLPAFPALYGRGLARPRPTPIYEKDGGSRDSSLCSNKTSSPRSRIAQATVVNLVRSHTSGHDASVPPPLPPRPSPHSSPASLPPLCNPKPALGIIRQGAVSLPRRRPEFHERLRAHGAPQSGAGACGIKNHQERMQDQKEKVKVFCTRDLFIDKP